MNVGMSAGKFRTSWQEKCYSLTLKAQNESEGQQLARLAILLRQHDYDFDAVCAALESNKPCPELDHPRLRARRSCSLCGGCKDVGPVVCWPCYRKHNLRNGNPEVGRVIDLAEGDIKPGPNDAKGD